MLRERTAHCGYHTSRGMRMERAWRREMASWLGNVGQEGRSKALRWVCPQRTDRKFRLKRQIQAVVAEEPDGTCQAGGSSALAAPEPCRTTVSTESNRRSQEFETRKIQTGLKGEKKALGCAVKAFSWTR